MNREHPKPQPEPVLPRKWNKNILPGCVVIAVDESDPKFPDQIITNPRELPVYPEEEKLLSNPDYLRLKRLCFESEFFLIREEDEDLKKELSFGSWLSFMRDFGSNFEGDNLRNEYNLTILTEVLADVFHNPRCRFIN